MLEKLREDVASLTGDLIAWRRDFHRHPEIAFQEHRTSRVLKEFMENIGLSVRPAAGTGLIGVVEGKPGGKTVALRADMDALPLKEEGEKAYLSENESTTHACAHDGHMAVLMGTAETLARRSKDFQGKVVFLFQPGEERIPGGAKAMIDEGCLDGVDAVFGLHFWQPLPTGTVGIVKGPMMAQPDDFKITVRGRGGHGSMPHTAIDSILVASQIVVNAQSIVSRNIDPLKPVVVSFGTIEGGTVYNIIPGEARLTGTVRTFDPGLQKLAEQRLREIVEGTCRTFGAEAVMEYEQGYPTLVNDGAMTDFVLEVVERTLGKDKIRKIDPVMGGEDFAYFLQKVPGAFLFFGMGDGMTFPHHHPAFDLDEKALPQATLLMCALAVEYLAGKS